MTRIKLVNATVACMFLLLFLGLFNSGLIHGANYRDLSNKNCIRILPQDAGRGRILDREGNILADNKLSYNVMLVPGQSNNLNQALLDVSRVLGAQIYDLKKALKRNLIAPAVPIAIAKNVNIKKAMALEELKTDIPGIIVQPQPIRHYPYAGLASHAMGYVSEIDRWRLTKLADYGYKTKDMVGFGGVEERYDYYLRQEEGGLSVEIDSRARLVRILGFKPPRRGKDLQLTLNLKIQKIAQEKLSDKKGCVIIMDPYSGEILAMASSPDFKPVLFAERADSFANLFNNPDAPMINRAISAAYPAGSIFKVIVATAALETKKINSSTTFLCTGSTFIGRNEFACWSTHNQQNLINAIAHSCNVFFYKTGLLVGAQTIHDYALKFGLSRVTSLDLPYEVSGFVPSPLWRKITKFKNWYDGDTANLAIGQGDCLVTPLQIARMMAVFANGGYLVTPYIVKAIDGKDISVYQRKNTPVPVKTETIDYIRQGLRGVVLDSAGTGNVLSGLPVSVAGKTGTAQVPHKYSHAWFTGFFPYKNPRFVICVLLEHGGPGYYACVVARQIIEQMVSEGLI